MMTERQTEFRRAYRSRISKIYNGYGHVAVILTIGALALFIYIRHIDSVRWWEWLTIPVVAFPCNMFEWALHKYVLHRPIDVTGLRAIYKRHALDHHNFFTDDEMRFRDHMDWRVTIFPPYAFVVFILMSVPLAAIAYYAVSPNAGWLLICTTTATYLIYEFMHFCCHVDESRFVRHCPLINTVRRHHTAHHSPRLMKDLNMNLTLPVSDWLFGTSDLDRGLLGHLFNGYNTAHLKKGLKGAPNTPDRAAAAPLGAE